MFVILPCLQIFLNQYTYLSAVALLMIIGGWIYMLIRGKV